MRRTSRRCANSWPPSVASSTGPTLNPTWTPTSSASKAFPPTRPSPPGTGSCARTSWRCAPRVGASEESRRVPRRLRTSTRMPRGRRRTRPAAVPLSAAAAAPATSPAGPAAPAATAETADAAAEAADATLAGAPPRCPTDPPGRCAPARAPTPATASVHAATSARAGAPVCRSHAAAGAGATPRPGPVHPRSRTPRNPPPRRNQRRQSRRRR
mmetsp:Transcript_12456/g.57688  ORF Transcript_12456/g.57688 Transcript_12456/m.57688 type:complete len:213 (-) Transcript_12456:1372-2010(-)